eukprot:CAMPEP_0117443574 /NCGR_PEP_ID=MMETSP0759-20121206/4764_1 /TAXON_ID=63605 /ORGANISM="Percolomonas cosmopolitus, Strain WS" /LENGTH=663 /DNA_ID=CAMNT_0005235551 /DNA_START=82 /DNA_END=2073 /DNA_ORIENTATION=-
MTQKTQSPFGSWKSPISPQLITQSSISFVEAKSYNNNLYFIEMRPSEKGRYVLRRFNAAETDRSIDDVKATNGVNVRGRVHEYGSDAWLVLEKQLPVKGLRNADQEQVLYSDFETQSLYLNERLIEDGTKTERRYANGVEDAVNDSFIYVCEDHSVVSKGEAKEPKNSIVQWKYDAEKDTFSLTTIAEGHDFYSSPALSSDGQRIAFVAWNHPQMPWDSTVLYEYNRSTGETTKIAGDGEESIMFPTYSPDDTLYFISDRSDGYWNIHRAGQDQQVECIFQKKAEFTSPAWRFGFVTFAFLDKDTLFCVHGSDQGAQLIKYDIPNRKATNQNAPFLSMSFLQLSQDKSKLFFIGGHPTEPTAVAEYNISTGEFHKIRVECEVDIDKSYYSVPQSLTFPSGDGVAYGYFYAPTNPEFEGPDGEKPIVLLKVHGGPTSAASTNFNLKYQFWTSRGIAVFDVNTAGSTGFGRDFRRKLYKNWGVYDIQDCKNAVKFLGQQGLANPKAAVIDGGSAGGYTTLACLAFTDAFAAGCSLYGVADLELLAAHTHKFESRYLDKLIGEYPKEKDIYIKRSPIHSIDSIKAPLLLLQGDEDKIVPPEQAEVMYNTMKEKGSVVALKMFKGEQHGFRGSEAQIQSLEMELYFFSKVLGFQPADNCTQVAIENL